MSVQLIQRQWYRTQKLTKTAVMYTQLPAKTRLFHLDALRAFCMLFGIFVHGATIGDNMFFEGVKAASDLFRMAAFMVISGYFTAMVESRAGTLGGFYHGRIPLLVYPLLACLLILNPVTTWLIHIWHNPAMSFTEWLSGGWRNPTRGNDVWHLHLWFLFCLIFYAAATPFLARLMRWPPISRLIDRYASVTAGWTVWANVLLVGMMVAACRLIHEAIVGPVFRDTPFSWIASATLTYFPYFFLGMVAFLHQGFFRSLHILSWTGLIVSTALYMGALYFEPDIPRELARPLIWLGRAGLTVFIICALMYVFQRYFNRGSAFQTFLVDASYTFYLVHMLVIYLIANLLGAYVGNIYLLFGLIAVLGTPLALAVHRYIVKPVPLFRLIFNGKRLRK